MKRKAGFAASFVIASALALVPPVLAQSKDVGSRPKASCSPVEHLTAWIKSVAGKNTCKTEANATFKAGSSPSPKSVTANKKT